MPNITVTKASGEKELFSQEKIRLSLSRAGTPDELIEKVISQITEEIYDGIPTRVLYRKIFAKLKKTKHVASAKYSLKQALLALGPTGYPFEKFVAAIFESQGYKTKVSQILQGKCISHEIDVIATQSDVTSLIECKYHNSPALRSSVHIPLYVKARFDDLNEANGKYENFWVVTNTKFSNDAVQYAKCAELKLVSWAYPQDNGLEKMIEHSHLHPISCMTTLSKSQLRSLFFKGIVLCRELNKEVLSQIGLSSKKQELVLTEARAICS